MELCTLNNEKPYYKQPVLWQSAASLLLYPLFIYIPSRLSLAANEGVAVAAVLIYLGCIFVSSFWSLSHFLSRVMQKQISYKTVLPLVFTAISLYTLIAMLNGYWPFLAMAQ